MSSESHGHSEAAGTGVENKYLWIIIPLAAYHFGLAASTDTDLVRFLAVGTGALFTLLVINDRLTAILKAVTKS